MFSFEAVRLEASIHDGGGDAWMLVQLNDMKKTYSLLLINELLTLNHLR